jgi:hypothetical protein
VNPEPRKIFHRSCSGLLAISFDCYVEGRYRKSLPTVPDYRIVVVDYNQPLPDASQLARLENRFSDQVVVFRFPLFVQSATGVIFSIDFVKFWFNFFAEPFKIFTNLLTLIERNESVGFTSIIQC